MIARLFYFVMKSCNRNWFTDWSFNLNIFIYLLFITHLIGLLVNINFNHRCNLLILRVIKNSNIKITIFVLVKRSIYLRLKSNIKELASFVERKPILKLRYFLDWFRLNIPDLNFRPNYNQVNHGTIHLPVPPYLKNRRLLSDF